MGIHDCILITTLNGAPIDVIRYENGRTREFRQIIEEICGEPVETFENVTVFRVNGVQFRAAILRYEKNDEGTVVGWIKERPTVYTHMMDLEQSHEWKEMQTYIYFDW